MSRLTKILNILYHLVSSLWLEMPIWRLLPPILSGGGSLLDMRSQAEHGSETGHSSHVKLTRIDMSRLTKILNILHEPTKNPLYLEMRTHQMFFSKLLNYCFYN
jgi:hypothetical protein